MSELDTEQLNVRVAADVKEALVADAAEKGASVNDLAVSILAEAFDVEFNGTGRRSPGARPTEGALNLRVPRDLYLAIDNAASERPRGSRTKVAVVDAVLREHFELAVAA